MEERGMILDRLVSEVPVAQAADMLAYPTGVDGLAFHHAAGHVYRPVGLTLRGALTRMGGARCIDEVAETMTEVLDGCICAALNA